LEPIVLSGRLDQYAAETLRDQAVALLDTEGDTVFDLSEVDQMHTAALQVLLALEKDLEPKGRKVVLRSVEGSLRDLFRISGAEGYFQFADGAE
jgi:anti-anti-sigma factor